MTPLTWEVGVRQLRPDWWEATATAGTWRLAERGLTRDDALALLQATIRDFDRMRA